MEKARKWFKSLYAKYSEETKVAVGVLSMMAVSLDLSYFYAADRSALAASFITCILLAVAFVGAIFFIPDAPVKNNSDGDFCRMTLMGSALAIFPHSLVFALPQIIAWQDGVWGYIVWFLVGLLGFVIGLALVQGWIEKDHCNSQLAYQMVFISLAISGGCLGKTAHGHWMWLWAIALFTSAITMAQQVYNCGRYERCNLYLVAIGCFVWAVCRYELSQAKSLLNSPIVSLVCLLALAAIFTLGLQISRRHPSPRPST